MLQLDHPPGVLDLGWGHPLPSLLPVDAWAAAARDAARSFGWTGLTYGYASGPGPFTEWLADRLVTIEDGGTSPEQIFVTGGASHALSLAAEVLTRPGDLALVDAPTYHLAFPILRDRGLEIAVLPEDLDELPPRARLIYTVPTFTNPTGRSLPLERRHALLSAARSRGVPIVEDDTYRELVYTPEPAPVSLWRLSGGDGTVVRLGSFAKTVAPGLRLGWITASPELVARLSRLGYVHSGGGVSHTTAMTMAAFGQSGGYVRHLARIVPAYRRMRDTLTSGVAGVLEVEVPDGGWFLWARLPPGVGAGRLLPVARAHGVSYVPGSSFFPDGTGGDDRIRLSFSRLPEPELAEAAARLTAAVVTIRTHASE